MTCKLQIQIGQFVTSCSQIYDSRNVFFYSSAIVFLARFNLIGILIFQFAFQIHILIRTIAVTFMKILRLNIHCHLNERFKLQLFDFKEQIFVLVGSVKNPLQSICPLTNTEACSGLSKCLVRIKLLFSAKHLH